LDRYPFLARHGPVIPDGEVDEPRPEGEKVVVEEPQLQPNEDAEVAIPLLQVEVLPVLEVFEEVLEVLEVLHVEVEEPQTAEVDSEDDGRPQRKKKKRGPKEKPQYAGLDMTQRRQAISRNSWGNRVAPYCYVCVHSIEMKEGEEEREEEQLCRTLFTNDKNCLLHQGRDSPIFLQFFYLFILYFFINCFEIASNSSGPSSDLERNSFQLTSDSPTFLNSLGKPEKKR
jgi:hypothetical protein